MLSGTLDDFTLPDVFRILSSCDKTGRLHIARSAGEGTVHFRDGDVYLAESSLTRDPLGQKLLRARLVSEVQLRQALDEQAESGKRLGEVLVESGVLGHEQIEATVRQQIEDAVFDLLRWELGEFSWEPGLEVDAEVSISVSVENLIIEASRKLDELEVITKKIPSEEAILTMAPSPPEDAAEINITPDEWRVLVLVNGTRSVVAIAEAVGLDNFSTMRVLYGLASSGLIEVSDTQASEALEEFEAAVAAEPPVQADEPAVEVEEPLVEEISEPLVAEVGSESELEAPAETVETAEVASEVDAIDQEATEEQDERTPEEVFADELLTDPVDFVPDESEGDGSGSNGSSESIPVTAGPDDEEVPVVDRLAAVKELADLFDPPDPEAAGPPYPPETHFAEEAAAAAAAAAEPPVFHRMEDDEEITKGLLSRLIDGVKGL
ncbi:MAG TPA: DUF4388 domain-containing protein, partial [Actinomycetota bacterium]|nr:DUF4388 domain-containing protein [Actinomycetota bacterium]